jgi:cell division protein FtsW (lipid II flippase)
VPLIATWVFSLASSVSGCVWVYVCLGLYAILVFPRLLIAVKCAVAGSLIATGV